MSFTISIHDIPYKAIHNFADYCGVVNLKFYPLLNPYYKTIVETELAKFNATFLNTDVTFVNTNNELTFDTEADYTWFLLTYN
jgi:hypothetical protein